MSSSKNQLTIPIVDKHTNHHTSVYERKVVPRPTRRGYFLFKWPLWYRAVIWQLYMKTPSERGRGPSSKEFYGRVMVLLPNLEEEYCTRTGRDKLTKGAVADRVDKARRKGELKSFKDLCTKASEYVDAVWEERKWS